MINLFQNEDFLNRIYKLNKYLEVKASDVKVSRELII